MVSFSCENCGDVLTKKKLDAHRNQCYGASYTCLDCMIHFQGTEYRSHTSCISEAQKYQGALYRPEKEKKNKQNNNNNSKALVPQNLKAYVEDADDESQDNNENENENENEIMEPMPSAPSPPSAAPGFTNEGSPVNVFDFLVASSTPNQSRLELPLPEQYMITDGRGDDMDEDEQEDNQRSLVRVHFEDAAQSTTDLVEYGNEPVVTHIHQYETPAPKHRKKEKKDRDPKEEKKDKKRKRLHVDTRDLSPREDETMTDAPPVLHSGLTGGLNRLMSRSDVFPPSPDYSGGDVDPSPGLKKTKHTKPVKRGRVDTISNGIMSLIGSKRVSSREHSDERPKRKQRKHRETTDRPKMIEYKPLAAEGAVQEDAQMVVYTPHSPRAELLLSFVTKGPESERGVSMNKALKRYHRERVSKGLALGKMSEEKELWRSLRMKKNDRGEIVLFL